MSDNIIQLNQELIHNELKDLVRNSVEETLNALEYTYKVSTYKVSGTGENSVNKCPKLLLKRGLHDKIRK